MTDDCVLREDCRLLYSYFLFFSALPSKLVILYNYFFMTPRNKIADRGQAGDELHPWCCLSPQDGAAIMNAKGLDSLQNSVLPKLDDCLIRYRHAQFRISPCLSECLWIMCASREPMSSPKEPHSRITVVRLLHLSPLSFPSHSKSSLDLPCEYHISESILSDEILTWWNHFYSRDSRSTHFTPSPLSDWILFLGLQLQSSDRTISR